MSNLSNYKAVILAGGKGTRLYPVTKEFPKPLLPVKRKPILNYLIDLFCSYRVNEIAILINQEFKEEFEWWKKRYYPSASSRPEGRGSPLKEAAGQVPDIKFFEENEPLGTFGGLWYLKDWIGKEPFFFSNGDELKKVDLLKMQKFHQKLKVPATIALVKVPNPQDYGVVVCKKGIVQEFLEKPKDPKSKYISSGLYLLTPEVFKYHPGPRFLMVEKDLFPRLAKEQKLAGFKFEGQWMDTGTFERWETAMHKWNQE